MQEEKGMKQAKISRK